MFCLITSTFGQAMHVDQDLGQELRDAAEVGNLARVRQLITWGAHVDEPNKFGHTPLQLAAANNHAEVARELLDNGACVNQTENICGDTPFHTAVFYGHKGVIHTLLANAACINQTNKHGNAPLVWAANIGKTYAINMVKKKQRL